jgi:putative peptidoglycan lipid II flippase
MVSIRPLIQFAFNFSAADTDMVVWTTRAYLFGLLGNCVFEVAARSFYAQQNARTPVLTSGFRLVAFVVIALVTFRTLGPAGIALADALAISMEAVILFVLLNRRYPGVLRLGSTLWRILIGSALAGILAAVVLNYLPLPLLPVTLGALALGALLTLPFAWPEVKSLVRL